MNNTGNAILILGVYYLGYVYGFEWHHFALIAWGLSTWLVMSWASERRDTLTELPRLIREIRLTLQEAQSYMRKLGEIE